MKDVLASVGRCNWCETVLWSHHATCHKYIIPFRKLEHAGRTKSSSICGEWKGLPCFQSHTTNSLIRWMARPNTLTLLAIVKNFGKITCFCYSELPPSSLSGSSFWLTLSSYHRWIVSQKPFAKLLQRHLAGKLIARCHSCFHFTSYVFQYQFEYLWLSLWTSRKCMWLLALEGAQCQKHNLCCGPGTTASPIMSFFTRQNISFFFCCCCCCCYWKQMGKCKEFVLPQRYFLSMYSSLLQA